jgi:GNAT superfamily N-acetyltransferase
LLVEGGFRGFPSFQMRPEGRSSIISVYEKNERRKETMRATVTTHHLELTDPCQLRPARIPDMELVLAQVKVPCPEFNRFFYTAAGGGWYWIDRLKWTYQQWHAYVNRPELETWAAYVSGTPVGYFELEMQTGSSVEIVYFGVLPQFTGRGIGGRLLTLAVERAWQIGAARVWLHTCTLDHPRALANYQARGFRQFKEVTGQEELPDQPPGPWPGAQIGGRE